VCQALGKLFDVSLIGPPYGRWAIADPACRDERIDRILMSLKNS
jgi:hypothetical protein